MIDLEISKSLALAIGHRVFNSAAVKDCWVWWHGVWRIFDYRDWSVIGPIAEKYSAFPSSISTGNFRKAKAQGYTDVRDWEVLMYDYRNGKEVSGAWKLTTAETPQKAIALAVIGAMK